jgi:hypothetical protein
MTAEDEAPPLPPDLSELAEQFPEWEFSSDWTEAASGPGWRNVTARHRTERVRLQAHGPTGLAEMLGQWGRSRGPA